MQASNNGGGSQGQSIKKYSRFYTLKSKTVLQLVTELQQLFGGYGFMLEYPIANFFASSRVLPIFGGSSEIMREIISRAL